MKLIQNEASGKKNEMSLLLVHAEDQLMSAEGFKILALEFIEIYKKFS
jgi:PTS system cellobiose-specific IIA component